MPGGWESLWVEKETTHALPRPGSSGSGLLVDHRVVNNPPADGRQEWEVAPTTPPQVSASFAALPPLLTNEHGNRNGGPIPFLRLPVSTDPSATLYGISPLSSDSTRDNENSSIENEKEHNELCLWNASTHNVCLQGPSTVSVLFLYPVRSSGFAIRTLNPNRNPNTNRNRNPNNNNNPNPNPNASSHPNPIPYP